MKKESKEINDITFSSVFVRDRGEGRGVRVAGPKPTDLSKANPTDGTAIGANIRKTKLAVMGLSAALLDAGDPRYAACMRLANSYRRARTREMVQNYGFVSSGVSALLAASAMALASSRFIYEIAANPERDEDGVYNKTQMAQLLKTASSLSDSARQNELSAWELCARESVVRKRNDANATQLPWMIQSSSGTKISKTASLPLITAAPIGASGTSNGLSAGLGGEGVSTAGNFPNGQVKRGRGRPRKVVLAVEEQNAGTVNIREDEGNGQESGQEPWRND